MNPVKAAPALSHFRAEHTTRSDFRVLIEVPELPEHRAPVGVASRRPRLVVEADSRPHRFPPRRPQTRRRLKREVKIAAGILFILLPFVFHASMVWSGRLGTIAASRLTRTAHSDDEREESGVGSALARQVSRSVFEPAVVLMSIEPAQTGFKTDAELPVNLPGYLLPEDSFEEITHEGS